MVGHGGDRAMDPHDQSRTRRLHREHDRPFARAAQRWAPRRRPPSRRRLRCGRVERTARALWRDGRDVYAEVALPEQAHGEAAGYRLHPALLDSALSATDFLGGRTPQDVGATQLPFAWAGVRMHGTGATRLRAKITWEGVNTPITCTPSDCIDSVLTYAGKEKFNLTHGSILGITHDFFNVLSFRHQARHPAVKGAYFVGASVHPGTGVPIAIAGSRLCAEAILSDLNLPVTVQRTTLQATMRITILQIEGLTSTHCTGCRSQSDEIAHGDII